MAPVLCRNWSSAMLLRSLSIYPQTVLASLSSFDTVKIGPPSRREKTFKVRVRMTFDPFIVFPVKLP